MNTKKIIALFLCVCMLITCMLTAPVFAENDDFLDSAWANFEQPSAEYKSAPLWFWNSELKDMTEEQVRTIVRESYEQSGYNGFGILPNWIQSYLSDEYFDLYEAALDEGSKLGMHFSLYDENGFPSYNAGGQFGEKFPDLTTKRLDKFEANGSNGKEVVVRIPAYGKFMGAVAMNTDTFERVDVSSYAHIEDPPPFDPANEPIGMSASSTYVIDPGYEPDKAADNNLNTRWNAGALSGGNQWLQINFGAPKTFDSVKIFEPTLAILHRITSYDIRYWDDQTDSWLVAATGTTITDAGATHTFAPVTAQLVRLHVKNVNTDSATITEFQVFNGATKLDVPPNPVVEIDEPGYSASTTYAQASGYEADKAFDDDPTTRWNSDGHAQAPQWLQMSYGKNVTINKVNILEHIGRISSFRIQCFVSGTWQTVHSGTTIGEAGITATFAPVTTNKIRLYIDSTAMSPTIWEFKTFNDATQIKPDFSGEEELTGSYVKYTVPAGNWKVMAFMTVAQGNNGMDYLSEDSVAAFIDITHNEYYKRFQRFFEDGTINSAFYDEPTFWPWGGVTAYGVEGARLWTPDYNEKYEAIWDESPVLNYPALWYDIGESTTQARDRLQYVRTELFATSYIKQMDDWCKDHGIELTGHMLLEEWGNPVGLHGDLMKVFEHQAIPGVDLIGHFGYTQEAYKIVSSSAYNYDHGKVMCETYGAMGAGMPVNYLYKCAMDLYAKGINLMIPHAVWYNKDQNVTYPPELSYRNPVYAAELPTYNNYISRISYMLQNGRHVADIAMLYPIDYLESVYWFNGQTNTPADADYMGVSETLSLNARKDFTYLHPDVIDRKVTTQNGLLKLNNDTNFEQYKVFIIPGAKVISLSNLQKIKAFYDAGGKVIGTTQLPYKGVNPSEDAQVAAIIESMFGVNPLNGNATTATTEAAGYTKLTNGNSGCAYFIKSGYGTKLPLVLDQAVNLYDLSFGPVSSIANGNLTYIHKVKENKDMYFIANSSDSAVSTYVDIKGKILPEIWYPQTGAKATPEYSVASKNGETYTRVTLQMQPVQSLFIVDKTVAVEQNLVTKLTPEKKRVFLDSTDDLKFTLSLGGVSDAYAYDYILEYDPSIMTLKSITPSQALLDSEYQPLIQTNVNGKIRIVFGTHLPITSSDYLNLFDIVFERNTSTGAIANLTITRANVGCVTGTAESAEDYPAQVTQQGRIELISVFNACDINKDGRVTLGDLSLAVKYYTAALGDSNWELAQKCDVNADDVVDMQDLIMISSQIS